MKGATMDKELLPDSAKSEESKPAPAITPPMITPSTQARADVVGALLAKVEKAMCTRGLDMSRLRTLYELECARLGFEATVYIPTESFEQELQKEADYRFRLIVQAFCQREGISITRPLMEEFERKAGPGRCRPFPLKYKSAVFDKEEQRGPETPNAQA